MPSLTAPSAISSIEESDHNHKGCKSFTRFLAETQKFISSNLSSSFNISASCPPLISGTMGQHTKANGIFWTTGENREAELVDKSIEKEVCDWKIGSGSDCSTYIATWITIISMKWERTVDVSIDDGLNEVLGCFVFDSWIYITFTVNWMANSWGHPRPLPLSFPQHIVNEILSLCLR